MGIVIFNRVSSLDYHIQVEHPPGYETPEKDYDVVHVPGRNGDIVLDKGSYKNVSRKYQIAVGSLEEDFTVMANRISEWVQSASGYARLEDSYEPEYYRLAMFKDSVFIENIYEHAGRTIIIFDCKPQRFLKQGDNPIKFVNAGILQNPTNFISLPIITVRGTGAGQFSVGGYTVIISDISTFTIINSEIQDAYKNTENRNSYVTLDNGFPKLAPGVNEISFSGGITSMEVIPKWWTL